MDMRAVTADEVKHAVQDAGITRIQIRDCSMCHYPLSYLISDDEIAYDAGCNCVSYHNIEPRTWDDLARHFNIQKPEIRARMWNELMGSPLTE